MLRGETCQGIVKGLSISCRMRQCWLRGLTEPVHWINFLNSRRKILPEAVLGITSTKWTSRGCL
jgi:hypothetical protein